MHSGGKTSFMKVTSIGSGPSITELSMSTILSKAKTFFHLLIKKTAVAIPLSREKVSTKKNTVLL